MPSAASPSSSSPRKTAVSLPSIRAGAGTSSPTSSPRKTLPPPTQSHHSPAPPTSSSKAAAVAPSTSSSPPARRTGEANVKAQPAPHRSQPQQQQQQQQQQRQQQSQKSGAASSSPRSLAIAAAPPADAAAAARTSNSTNNSNDNVMTAAAAQQQQQPTADPPTPPPPQSAQSCLPEIKNAIAKNEHRRAIELLDECIGSPTYADLPMFDDEYEDPPQYDTHTLLSMLSLRINCWISLQQFGRAIEDISSAMKVDLQTAMLRADFVLPKLQAIYELGDTQIGLQVASSLEVACQRNGALLAEITEWKRKFVLASRKKNEVVAQDNQIVIGTRRIAAGAPGCRHGCPDREPPSFFQMEIVLHQMQCNDVFMSLYRLYTEYDGAKLPWKHWARQELRKAIDAAAVENWKQCRDSTRHFLLATEFSMKSGEHFVDAMDTLGRCPNPLHVDITRNFFKLYDRTTSTIDDLVEMLGEISKRFCSCASEIAEVRSRRVKKADKSSSSMLPTSHHNYNNNNSDNADASTAAAHAVVLPAPSLPAPGAIIAHQKEKEALRESARLRDDGNVLFLARKFRTALQRYDEAFQLDQKNTELLFNRTAALYELEQFDAAVMACDKAMSHAAEHNSSDRVLVAKILARRGDALVKLGALDEALVNYQESCDAVDNPKCREKMYDCQVQMKQKKMMEQQASSEKANDAAAVAIHAGNDEAGNDGADNNNNNNNNEDTKDKSLLALSLLPSHNPPLSGTTSNNNPRPSFASCVIVEPLSSRSAREGNASLAVFPTQIATASRFYADAIPIPLMKHADFPFFIVPAAMSTDHHNSPIHRGGGTDSENYFALLATKPLSIDKSDLPHHHHMRNELWSTCGSVIILRSDFKPVTCGQVLRFYRMLLELWTLSELPEDDTDHTLDDEVRRKKLMRLELFTDAAAARTKLLETVGKSLDRHDDDDPDHDAGGGGGGGLAMDDDDDDEVAGMHVMNTFSPRAKLSQHYKERDIKQAILLKEQGNVLYKGRRFRTAILRYDEGLALDPTNIEILYNRAACLIELGHFDMATESCNSALEMAQQHRPADARLHEKIVTRRDYAMRKGGILPPEWAQLPANSLDLPREQRMLLEAQQQQQQQQEQQEQEHLIDDSEQHE